jgi:stage II sporulation protein P
MVNLGNIVEDKLNSLGISTLHDKTMHDYPEYNGSYTRAAKTINSYLKKYPSIKIVIDMHRDAVASGSDKIKLTADINGKKAAQVMLVMGSQSGSVTNFPNWKENLKLAVRFQQTMEVMYPGLARPLSLTSKNYNESLTNGSILLEMGTDANSIQEVEYSAELVGNALVSLLNTLK